MRIKFKEPAHNVNTGGRTLVAEAALVFGPEDSVLDGLQVVGFSVWRDGDMYDVTLPGRAFGAGSERRIYDYMRPAEGHDFLTVQKFKHVILSAMQAWEAGGKVVETPASCYAAPCGGSQVKR